jgi:hypothetical protein
MTSTAIRLLLVWCCWSGLSFATPISAQSAGANTESDGVWERLLVEADRHHLPTKFLKELPPGFVRFEFEDLRTYAAEYHPSEHRLLLNRALSLNAAGRTLKPLAKMTHKELEVLYHELFHAYMDYLTWAEEQSGPVGGESRLLLNFARLQQGCRYREVMITPVAQRKEERESRYLTETESWEALNETWAVFIGWAVWNQLEVERRGRGLMLQNRHQMDHWGKRLESAFKNGDLRGYYVPQDPEERRIAQKRFLAKQSQLSWREAVELMRQVLGFPRKFIDQLGRRLSSVETGTEGSGCQVPTR